jgi:pyruvate formate lyase activating enzyme
MNGRIFDIRRYSIHDGPGIRTSVFFKGCSLRCSWCHNPEGISPEFELMYWKSRCRLSYDCIKACPMNAIRKDEKGSISIDRNLCDMCGECAAACLYEAMQIVGRDVTVAEVMGELEKDRAFFDQSGGGVTFTGGEPLNQPEFLEELIDSSNRAGLSVALDTSGYAPADFFHRIASKVDIVLFDLKIIDEARHKEFTGVSNRLILENFYSLSGIKTEVWLRMPLIPGATDDEKNIKAIIDLLRETNNIRNLGLLPYHWGGMDKAMRLDNASSFKNFERMSEERYERIEKELREAGFEIRKGG